jgi:5-(carboxyamino)imidazole ribonucleotide synthase
VFNALQYVGVLAIEFFEHDGSLLANEMAPRVHNSGHWTIEGAVTSQFENHLRAVMGLPLGSTTALGSSAMLNLIGEVPDSAEVLAVRDAHLHLYGKSPRAGRKLGHVTVRATSSEQLASRLAELPVFFHRPDFCLEAALSPASSRA